MQSKNRPVVRDSADLEGCRCVFGLKRLLEKLPGDESRQLEPHWQTRLLLCFHQRKARKHTYVNRVCVCVFSACIAELRLRQQNEGLLLLPVNLTDTELPVRL